MHRFFSSYATRSNLLLLVALTILNNVSLVWFFRDFPDPILDTFLFYTDEEAYAIIENYGAEYRNMYIRGTLLLDFVYPVVYCLMLAFGIFRLSKHAGWASFPLWILPVDYLENGTLIFLLSQYPEEYRLIASAVGFVTCTKWTMVMASVLFILRALWVRYIMKRPNYP